MNTHDLEAFQTLVLHEGRNYSLARNFSSWKDTADKLHTLYEQQCNGLLGTAGEDKIKELQGDLRMQLLDVDCIEAVRFNRDPRGKPIKIYFDQERAENNHTADVRI